MSSAAKLFGHFAFSGGLSGQKFWMAFLGKTRWKMVAQALKKGYD